MAYKSRFSILAAAAAIAFAASTAWDYGTTRVLDFFDAMIGLVDWRPTANESLELDRAIRETSTADKQRRPFTAFIERARSHLRFLGDGFTEPGYSAT